MALTIDQQAQLEMQQAMDAQRYAAEAVTHAKTHKLEAIRIAQQTLVENSRTAPADSASISADDIVAYATTLVAYVNS